MASNDSGCSLDLLFHEDLHLTEKMKRGFASHGGNNELAAN
jgi:hypothetical protein